MEENATKRNYSPADMDLYEILLMAWGNFDEHMDTFKKFKGVYSLEYSAQNILEIKAARALPSATARYAPAEIYRLTMVKQSGVIMQNFKYLKSYIRRAYSSTDLQKIYYKEAGQEFYKPVSNESWSSVGELNETMIDFITLHEGDLKGADDKNMPGTFKAKCEDDAKSFSDTLELFKKAVQTSEKTAAKIRANNAIYAKGIEMMLDGQLLFAKERDVEVRFIFSRLWDILSPPVSGVKGAVMTAENKVVPFAEIIIEREGKPLEVITADENGHYERRAAAGPVKITATGYGMSSETIEETVNLGAYKKHDFVLRAA